MKDIFSSVDDLGPSKIIHVYEPSVNLKVVLVVDKGARGPSIGGKRMAEDASLLKNFP
jgi:glutamate dehydrogenase (NAD(P)+)